MVESMVERVARAIFEAEYPGGETDEYRWERSSDVYFDQARAAIEAMREPTDAMVDAGVDADYGGTLGSRAVNCFTAMIDAALNEQVAE